ncbi:MAG: 30S ribosomal protein S6 [Deltaproteobacteria bacterium]|nr:30S ribosomal protein S6 [Deltaproteobacteria bacterium]
MKAYETILIAHPDLSEEDLKGITERVKEVIARGGGAVTQVEEWGKRKLAYEVKRQQRGHYVLVRYTGTPALITEVNRQLKYTDKVIKYLTVRVKEGAEASPGMAAAGEGLPVAAAAPGEGPAAEPPAGEGPAAEPPAGEGPRA